MLYFIVKNFRQYENAIFEEGLQNFIWDNVHPCNLCNGTRTASQKNI